VRLLGRLLWAVVRLAVVVWALALVAVLLVGLALFAGFSQLCPRLRRLR
jgi:hypothetical protein